MTIPLYLLLAVTSTMACLSAEHGAGSRAAMELGIFPSVADFFPEIGSDFSRVKWGHAVNSRAALQQSLDGTDMMIEADVSMGTLTTGNDSTVLPIMAHPPHKTSDLSLEQFLTTILESGKRKGIKLDFKDIDIVEPAFAMLKRQEDKVMAFIQMAPKWQINIQLFLCLTTLKITVPLWLNADIVAGPVKAATRPLDAARFLSLVKQFFPLAVISVGWTTRFGPDITTMPPSIVTDGSYSSDQVKSLRDALVDAEIHQPVTFPIRAGIAASDESQTSLTWLLKQIPDSTLTIWSAEYDTVNVPGLMRLIQNVGKERIYIDVPAGLSCQIRHFDHDLDL